MDPIDYQVIVNKLSGIAQEMQNALFRTGYSTIIRESQDASCAILTKDGRVVGQHVVLPLHMGAFPECIAGIRRRFRDEEIEEGDAFIVGSPYEGGSPHANDFAVITPIFHDGELFGFCANIAHKSDIGGTVPGSGPGNATEIYHEGLQLPAVKYVSRYEPRRDIEAIIELNSRTPRVVLGDISGQIGTNRLGERRMRQLVDRYGKSTLLEAFDELFDRTEARVRAGLAGWPDGVYEGEGWLDNDGIQLDRRVRIHVRITKRGDSIHFDFSGSDPHTRGPANVRPHIVLACCYYALVALIDPTLAPNHGLRCAIEVTCKEGTILNPPLPSPVGTYILTSQIVVDTILRALASAVPGKSIAGSGGDGAFVIGGSRGNGETYVQYEIFGSAYGASRARDGVSGVDPHVANCRIAPVEIVESEFPVRVRRFEPIRDSGGAGEHRGGLGFLREYEVLEDGGRLSAKFDKHAVPAWGIEGGSPGKPGGISLNHGSGEAVSLPPRIGDVSLCSGDVLRFERPGGGGFGAPGRRDRRRVVEDVLDGYVSVEKAREDYGVDPDPSELEQGEPVNAVSVEYDRQSGRR